VIAKPHAVRRVDHHVSVWDGALKNYAPNFGYDHSGRLMAPWLER